jgi:hypothetical protein
MNSSESSYRDPRAGPRCPIQVSLISQALHPKTEAQVAPCSTSIFLRL